MKIYNVRANLDFYDIRSIKTTAQRTIYKIVAANFKMPYIFIFSAFYSKEFNSFSKAIIY